MVGEIRMGDHRDTHDMCALPSNKPQQEVADRERRVLQIPIPSLLTECRRIFPRAQGAHQLSARLGGRAHAASMRLGHMQRAHPCNSTRLGLMMQAHPCTSMRLSPVSLVHSVAYQRMSSLFAMQGRGGHSIQCGLCMDMI